MKGTQNVKVEWFGGSQGLFKVIENSTHRLDCHGKYFHILYDL